MSLKNMCPDAMGFSKRGPPWPREDRGGLRFSVHSLQEDRLLNPDSFPLISKLISLYPEADLTPHRRHVHAVPCPLPLCRDEQDQRV